MGLLKLLLAGLTISLPIAVPCLAQVPHWSATGDVVSSEANGRSAASLGALSTWFSIGQCPSTRTRLRSQPGNLLENG